MGMLAALAGLVFATRFNAASPKAGLNFELEAIAAAFIGGASMAGGVGTVLGAIIGGLVLGVLNNGMNLVGIGTDWQQVIKGLVLLAALCWAANIVYVRAHRWVTPPFELAFWQALLASVVLTALAWATEGAPRVIWSPGLAWLLGYGGVFGIAVAYWAAVNVNRSLPAGLTALGLLGVPVVGFCHTDAAALAALHFGEWAEAPTFTFWAQAYQRFDHVVAPSRHMAARLADAGVDVELVRYDGLIHGFFGLLATELTDSRDAHARVIAALRAL